MTTIHHDVDEGACARASDHRSLTRGCLSRIYTTTRLALVLLGAPAAGCGGPDVQCHLTCGDMCGGGPYCLTSEEEAAMEEKADEYGMCDGECEITDEDHCEAKDGGCVGCRGPDCR